MLVLRSIVILSITQIIAWGVMLMAISVTAIGMAGDLGLTPSSVYLGPTVMLVAMARRACGCLQAPKGRLPILWPGPSSGWRVPRL